MQSSTTVYAVYDIETVPNERAAAYFKSKTYEPDSRLKDPEKIEASIREKRQRDMDKAALHWWTGKVICINATIVNGTGTPPTQTFASASEIDVLTGFFDWLSDATYIYGSNLVLIGKSSDHFDTPFIIGRAMAHNIGLLPCMRPYRPLTDLNNIFGYSSACDQRSTLSDYAFGLGIDGKNGHGSMVHTLYAEAIMGNEGRWDEIKAYCAQDNHINQVMLQRWLKNYETQVVAPDPIISDIPF